MTRKLNGMSRMAFGHSDILPIFHLCLSIYRLSRLCLSGDLGVCTCVRAVISRLVHSVTNFSHASY